LLSQRRFAGKKLSMLLLVFLQSPNDFLCSYSAKKYIFIVISFLQALASCFYFQGFLHVVMGECGNRDLDESMPLSLSLAALLEGRRNFTKWINFSINIFKKKIRKVNE